MNEAGEGGSVGRVRAALRAAGHADTISMFPAGTRTAEDAAHAVGCTVAQIAKSLVFRAKGLGRPVLVMQNLRTPGFPVWHYAVVVGQDRASNRVVLNSGTREGMRQRAPSFLRTWDWAQRWGMVALRPGELPASADPLRYAEAVAAFEAVAGGAAARPAWEAALAHWPQDHRAALALGNAAHAAGDPAAAIAFFEEGLARRPGDAVLANNLASLLGARGCPARGHALLAPVLAGLPEDSPWRSALERTLEGLAGREDGPGCRD